MPRSALALLILSAVTACATEPPPVPIGPRGPSGGLFISPMGEPFRAAEAGPDLIGAWFAATDANKDGSLTAAEMEVDAARFFRTLDTNNDGRLTPPEMVHYEREVAPEIQLGSQMERRRRPGAGGAGPEGPREEERDPQQFMPDREGPPRRQAGPPLPQGATRYALLDLPQPVAAADADFDRAVSAAEFADAAKERFATLDRDRDGRITRQELEPLPLVPVPQRSK